MRIHDEDRGEFEELDEHRRFWSNECAKGPFSGSSGFELRLDNSR